MVTWEEINARISQFLEDIVSEEGVEAKFGDKLRIASWNWAQDVFISHTALEKSMQLVVDRDNRTALLPEDFIEVAMVYDAGEAMFLNRAKFQHGTLHDEYEDNDDFWVWGRTLYLERSVGFSEDLTLHYYAYYPAVEWTEIDDEFLVSAGDILVPRWAELALTHLTVASILQPHAVVASMSRNYNIMIDSGTPVMNSRAQQAMEHLKWYTELIAMHTPQPRMGGITAR